MKLLKYISIVLLLASCVKQSHNANVNVLFVKNNEGYVMLYMYSPDKVNVSGNTTINFDLYSADKFIRHNTRDVSVGFNGFECRRYITDFNVSGISDPTIINFSIQDFPGIHFNVSSKVVL